MRHGLWIFLFSQVVLASPNILRVETDSSLNSRPSAGADWHIDHFFRRSNPSLQDFEAILSDTSVRTLPDFLSRLPAEFLSSYTLMYKSRSLQGATYENPRAIVYGGDARLVMSFNGDESLRGGKTLEIMEYAPHDQRFYFHQIAFENGQAPVFNKHVARCNTCHRAGENARPLWESWPMWPGAYSSFDDSFAKIEGDAQPLKKLRDTFNSIQEKELEELKKWFAQKDSHPRYRWLGKIEVLKKGESLLKHEDYRDFQETFALYPFCRLDMDCEMGFQGGSLSGDLLMRPNTRLGILLANLQADKLARRMQSTKRAEMSPSGPAMRASSLAEDSHAVGYERFMAQCQPEAHAAESSGSRWVSAAAERSRERRRLRAGLPKELFLEEHRSDRGHDDNGNNGDEERHDKNDADPPSREFDLELARIENRLKDRSGHEQIEARDSLCRSAYFGIEFDQWTLSSEPHSTQSLAWMTPLSLVATERLRALDQEAGVKPGEDFRGSPLREPSRRPLADVVKELRRLTAIEEE